jgi:hypothetical protein
MHRKKIGMTLKFRSYLSLTSERKQKDRLTAMQIA